MRKRKKTATPGCTIPGKSTHTSCRGGLRSQANKHLPPPQISTKPRHSLPNPAPCSHPGLSLHSGDFYLFPGLVAMPLIPSSRENFSDLEPTVHPQTREGRGVAEAPYKGTLCRRHHLPGRTTPKPQRPLGAQ